MANYIVSAHGAGTPTTAQLNEAKAAFSAWIASLGPAITNPHQTLQTCAASGAGTTVFAVTGPTILTTPTEATLDALIAAHPLHTTNPTLTRATA